MTFLDQREVAVRDGTARNKIMSRVGVPAAHLAVRAKLGRIRVPMRVASKMTALVNDRKALRAFLRDRSSAGAWVSLRFLSTYMNPQPAAEPEDFDTCPVLLTQPGADAWTPVELSQPFISRIHNVDVQLVTLPDAGHYPLEAPAIERMHDAIEAFLNTLRDA